ncbi:MAG: ArnT family glycosyltransferase [Isosphaeraceae bacterium]
MRAEPRESSEPTRRSPRWCLPSVFLAAILGLWLLADTATRISATYDEVTYLQVASRWWRTGEQEGITRMGSPLTFWKLQQVPVLWALDRLGRSDLIDAPIARRRELLPLVRIGGLWLWLVGLGVVAWWSRTLHGPRAMALAAWMYALSPNVLAHASLSTMESPLLALSALAFALFWWFRTTGAAWAFWGSAILNGLAFSCKFTAVLLPPLLGLAWWVDLVWSGEARALSAAWRVGRGMAAFVMVTLLADFVVTAGALLPLSHSQGGGHPSLDGRFGPRVGALVTRLVETPIPQDWVGFATQMRHQRSGGSSYLLGERREHGWWYYYLVAMAVKVPPAFWLTVVGAVWWTARSGGARFRVMIPVVVLAFLAVTALGSSRNYGLRYLLPLAPLAIVGVSGLAERGRKALAVGVVGLAGQAWATATIHPHELTYFHVFAGGPIGGRRVLADSNLDWGQGLIDLARLQAERPEFRDLTLYYFGETDPRHYGVEGTHHVIDAGSAHPGLPPEPTAASRYVGVSASLQWGPWGPEGYFRDLNTIEPVAMTADTTIAIYRARDLGAASP